jgi:CRISPR-associated protein Cas5t
MMNEVLEVKFSGWTATPRMPFILSGNAICLPVPTYSLLLGMLGCCLGRIIKPKEIKIGFNYNYDTVAYDLEKRQRVEFDGKRLREHHKGGDVYTREYHINPFLTVWLDRIDWEVYFLSPIGTPSLGRSQDILKIESVKRMPVKEISSAKLCGCMLPYKIGMNVAGQLVQLAEAYNENEQVGSGITPLRVTTFIAIPPMSYDISAYSINEISMPSLYSTMGEDKKDFYLHIF